MKRQIRIGLGLVLWLTSLVAAQATHPALRLASLFQDNMVLQQDAACPVWGWASPGQTVTVQLAGQTKSAAADKEGKWSLRLDPIKGGAALLEMTVANGDEAQTVRVRNVLVGEVWICSGQSNMEWSVRQCRDADREIESADHPTIRVFTLPHVTAGEPQATCPGAWRVCSPATVARFSAVGYYFGRHVHKTLGNLPVGLIVTCWSGSAAEPWTPIDAMRGKPQLDPLVQKYDQALADWQTRRPALEEAYQQAMVKHQRDRDDWAARIDATDKGIIGKWADPATAANGWKTIKQPAANWSDTEPSLAIPRGAGVIVWLRRTIDVPADLAGKDLVLKLGPVDDVDQTFLNGEQVGATGYDVSDSAFVARAYKVPGRLVKAGANTLAIRVTNVSGEGGMTGRPAECRLELPGTDKGVALAGDWAYEVGLRFERKTMPTAPKPPAHPAAGGASGMYNAMIAPLAPYAIRGAIWYQGESNAGRAYAYRTLLPTMIGAWRKAFDNEFTFLIVQLANFLARTPQPGESAWAELREAQAMTAANTPKCGLAVTIDIGEANDIHPKNKQDVGRRLGLGAEAIAYGRQIVHSGPVYDSMKIEGDKVRLVFRHVGGGLDTRVGTSFAPATQPAPDGKLTGFAIAGEDRKFVWAEARIEGESVVVWSNAVPKPVAVRYAWADNPACNLYNKAGLPAVPFRTDDWSGVTIPKPTTATTRQGPGAGPMHQRWSNVRM